MALSLPLPDAPRNAVARRFELREDTANLLAEHARNMSLSLGIAEADALSRRLQGLNTDVPVVNEREAE